MAAKPLKFGNSPRTFDARPDTIDFRDRMFVPTLVAVPQAIALAAYKEVKCPVLNQGTEGACTGFGLAAVVNFLLRRRNPADTTEVSQRMLYEMAKRYDEWEGEDYSGSSARGAMKGWHKHGVCTSDRWPYSPGRNDSGLTRERSLDAIDRPLGAYFRVNHRDIVAMHAALTEVEILYATSIVHEGWSRVAGNGDIPFDPRSTGGHAFAIVAFDRQGFWIQNSWGEGWGLDGFARISYDDWLQNATDVWVARLGAPIELDSARSVSIGTNVHSGNPEAYTAYELRPHIVAIGNDGKLRSHGAYGTDENAVNELFGRSLPEITAAWKKKRILLYAHGGLVSEKSALQTLSENREALLENEVYPISFIWKSDFWTTLKNILNDSLRRRKPEGLLDATKDFLLDRLDDALEPIARLTTGKMQWDEMKENALAATESANGGASILLKRLETLLKADPTWEIHLVGHSAGSIFLAPIVQLITGSGRIAAGLLKNRSGLGRSIQSLSLWAPACTIELFNAYYSKPLKEQKIRDFALYTLTDRAEQDDHCARIYNKSLLYLVSNAFEDKPRIPLFRDGIPILGMEKFVSQDARLQQLLKLKHCRMILSPDGSAANATSHGGFDDDRATKESTFARIQGKRSVSLGGIAHLGTASVRERRRRLNDGTI